MKVFVENLKRWDYKQLAIEHGDKAVFGIALLFISVGLAGTSWSRYERQPEKILNRVNTETVNLQTSRWPEAKRNQYDSVRDIGEAVKELLTPLSVTKFEYGTPFKFGLYKPQDRIREPDWLAVLELIADYSTFIFEYRPEVPVDPDARNKILVDQVGKDKSGSKKWLNPNSPLGPSGGRNPDVPLPMVEDEEAEAEEDTDDMDDDTDVEDLNARRRSAVVGIRFIEINAEGKRFIAIRGLFPLKKQLDKLARALNEDDPAKAADLLEIIDFELERQTAVGGPDPWSGRWEPVDIQVALDVLDTVDEYDADVVSSALTDPVITMPLLRRLAGEWDFWGGHPKLKILSKKQREIQMLINAKTLQAITQKLKERHKVEKGGFAKKQHDIRGARRRLGQDMQTIRRQAMEELTSPKTRSRRRGMMNMGANATIVGQVLLFRYFDFSIEPGNAYRYRVRLVVRNPNHQRPIVDLNNPDSAKDTTRLTPWSNLTGPVVVPSDVEMFLTKVLPGKLQVSAKFNVFNWYEKAGTTVEAELKDIVPGQIIAAFTKKSKDGKISGGIETIVLRPANRTMKFEKHVEIVTQNVLLDVDGRPNLAVEDHPDLELDFRRRREYLTPDQVIVVNQYCELESLNNVTQQAQRQAARRNLERERSPWKEFMK